MKMSILLDQLMGEREFLRYCREDYLGGMIGMSIWSQDGISSAVISNFTSSLVQE